MIVLLLLCFSFFECRVVWCEMSWNEMKRDTLNATHPLGFITYTRIDREHFEACVWLANPYNSITTIVRSLLWIYYNLSCNTLWFSSFAVSLYHFFLHFVYSAVEVFNYFHLCISSPTLIVCFSLFLTSLNGYSLLVD